MKGPILKTVVPVESRNSERISSRKRSRTQGERLNKNSLVVSGEELMNKQFAVEKYGKVSYCIIRQMPHDPKYVVGSTIPGFGKVVGYDAATIASAQNDPDTSAGSNRT